MTARPRDGKSEGPVGIECPRCGCAHCPVYYTRRRSGGRCVRRRECRHCGARFSTSERIQGAP